MKKRYWGLLLSFLLVGCGHEKEVLTCTQTMTQDHWMQTVQVQATFQENQIITTHLLVQLEQTGVEEISSVFATYDETFHNLQVDLAQDKAITMAVKETPKKRVGEIDINMKKVIESNLDGFGIGLEKGQTKSSWKQAMEWNHFQCS